MIAAWMLYCLAFGALIVCAAFPMERFVLERGGPSRRVWVLGLLAAVLLPVVAVIVKDAPPGFEQGNQVVASSPASGAVMSGVQSLASLDGALGLVWMSASALLALVLMTCVLITAWRRRRWEATEVDGVSVLVSDDIGPAVVGFVRGRIVLPRWVLSMDVDERTMMLRHEEEHVRAGDPRLVLFGALALVAVPWNAALWLMVHRMRLAIEVDCDRRVLTGSSLDLRRYAELLLAVGARRAAPVYGVGFSVGRPFLEQRIDRMTLPGRERRRAHMLLVGLGVLGVLAAAWSLPQPVRAAFVSETFQSCPDEKVWTGPEVGRALIDAYDWST